MKDFTLPIWISNYLNRNDNCEYPHSNNATDAAMLKKLVEKDHVFISFKNNYRNKTNFQHTDSLVSDCDNDHSDKEDDWITPEKIKAAFPDVSFVVYTSRHHMLARAFLWFRTPAAKRFCVLTRTILFCLPTLFIL